MEDTTTGLRWLNLAVTQGQSLNAVIGQLSTTYSGFSVASLEQIDTFAANAGVVTNTGVQSGTNAALELLLTMWGTTYSSNFNGSNKTSYVRTSSTNPQFPGQTATAIFTASRRFPVARRRRFGTRSPRTAISIRLCWRAPTLQWAYKCRPSPLPAAAWLLFSGLGIVGLIGGRTKHSITGPLLARLKPASAKCMRWHAWS